MLLGLATTLESFILVYREHITINQKKTELVLFFEKFLLGTILVYSFT